MKKILFVEDLSQRRFLLGAALSFYNYKTRIITADSVNKCIEEETPDFVFLNIKEPASGEDMKSFFENLKSDHRLRVRIVDTSNHRLKFSNLLPFEHFDDMINSINEKIYRQLLNFKKK